MFANDIDFDNLSDHGPGGEKRNHFGVQSLYAQSKFGNVVFANELARRHGDQGILSVSLNPGNTKTEIERHLPSFVTKMFNAVVMYPTSMGAITQLWAGTSPEALDLNGKYLIPWAREGPVNPEDGCRTE